MRAAFSPAERLVNVQRVGDIQALHVAYRVPALGHADSAAVDLLTAALGNAPAGRLHSALVESKKAVQISGTHRMFLEEGVANFVAVVSKNSSLDGARATMLATLDAIVT